jgi:2-polyprenyl-6-hydroxyphenyl methylase/3-demethylubiquinone-9 3-methyltransferase
MTPGRFVRTILGPAFPLAGGAYRRLFVDMARVVDAMLPHVPNGAHVLDIGGGDGFVINILLNRRPDVTVTMTDLAADIGGFISTQNRARVRLLPETDLTDVAGQFDLATLFDVIHHVPVAARSGFLASVAATAERAGVSRILIKDIRPGGLRAKLAELGDIHITGDRSVSLLAEDAITLPGFTPTSRTMPDFPNYLLVFEKATCP